MFWTKYVQRVALAKGVRSHAADCEIRAFTLKYHFQDLEPSEGLCKASVSSWWNCSPPQKARKIWKNVSNTGQRRCREVRSPNDKRSEELCPDNEASNKDFYYHASRGRVLQGCETLGRLA